MQDECTTGSQARTLPELVARSSLKGASGKIPVLANGPQMAVVVSKVVFTILQQEQGKSVFSIPGAHAVQRQAEAARLLNRRRIDFIALNFGG